MQPNHFINFMRTVETSISFETLLGMLSASQNLCLFVKNERSTYCYANTNYVQLMGLYTLNQLLQLNDTDLYKKKSVSAKYKEHDNYVTEERKPLAVSELISPYYNQPIAKMMEGTLYPLASENAQFVLGLVQPRSQLLKLDFDTIFKLNQCELSELLVKRTYSLRLSFGSISLSRMEIRCLIQLLKGNHAGEIAAELAIKQSTVESYLINIKNKLGVNSKSELLNLVIREKILEQVTI